MQIDAIEGMVQQYRETMEGDVGASWITDGKPDSGVLGFVDTLTPEQAYAAPVPDGRSVAGHVAHLRFSLELFAQRMRGGNPPADWESSFNLDGEDDAAWSALKANLRRAYDETMGIIQEQAKTPLAQWPGIYVAGLSAMTAHNAYHLGAIRQIARVVQAG